MKTCINSQHNKNNYNVIINMIKFSDVYFLFYKLTLFKLL